MVTYRELLGFVWKEMRPLKWAFLAIFLIDFFTWPLDNLIWPYIIRMVVDICVQYEGNRTLAAFTVPVITVLCLVTYVECASRTMGFMLARVGPKLQSNLRIRMFDHVQHHTPHYFNERFAGLLANKITDMTTQIESVIQQLFWPIVPTLALCLMGSFFLWSIYPILPWIMLSWIAVHLTVCIYFAKSSDRVQEEHGELRSQLLGKIVDSFTNNFAVNLFCRFGFERRGIATFQEKEQGANIAARRYVEKMRCFLSIFTALGMVIGFNGVLIYLWIGNQITTGQVMQGFTMGWSYVWILWAVSSELPALFQSIGTIKQAYTVMLDPQDLGDSPNAKELRVTKGEIVFDKVSFQYGDKPLFQEKQVHIRGGEKVGLVGFSGAGKSTFISLILRFYPLHAGRILIDGQEIADVTLSSLRSHIALIPQDPVLFHRTLRENISYGKPEASSEEILRVSKLAHCDEFIRSIPNGYDATVGERGTKLSTGEKQRIAIARALLVNAPILILDEATSALDSVTEKYIQDSLDRLMENRTTVVIAHRLATLARMDRLLIFDKGKIVEEGTHSALLAKGGLYARLWNMQVGGFLPN